METKKKKTSKSRELLAKNKRKKRDSQFLRKDKAQVINESDWNSKELVISASVIKIQKRMCALIWKRQNFLYHTLYINTYMYNWTYSISIQTIKIRLRVGVQIIFII